MVDKGGQTWSKGELWVKNRICTTGRPSKMFINREETGNYLRLSISRQAWRGQGKGKEQSCPENTNGKGDHGLECWGRGCPFRCLSEKKTIMRG